MIESREFNATILIADLSGYTSLTEAHGSHAAADTISRYMELVRESLVPPAKLVERVGDEVLIVGEESAGVLRTAVRLMAAVEREPMYLTLHSGLHAGRLLQRDGSYFGTSLNLAARVAAYARGGQVLCTEQVVHLSVQVDELMFRPLEPVVFKNVGEPVILYEVISKEKAPELRFIDPVCKMRIDPGTATARLPYGGQAYYFCSLDCAKAFANHPQRYTGVSSPNARGAQTDQVADH